MNKLTSLAKLYEMKVVYLDEAVFTFNTFSTKAWSAPYTSISVKEASIKVRAQALIAAISEDVGLELYMLNPKSINTEQFVSFLE